jgi:quercetin dioxygenase-like cupin family protein
VEPQPQEQPTEAAATVEPPEATPAAPAEPPAPAKPASTDPVDVGPGIYSMVTENEAVRVLQVTFAPGAEIGMHKHPDHFAYVIAPGKLTITDGDGKSQEMDLKAGQGVFIPAQTHKAKNTGTTEAKAVIVEFRAAAGTAGPKGTDPLKAGGKMYSKVFENERVRAMVVTFAKGAKIAKHTHPDHVAYALTDGKLKVTPEKGDAQEVELKAGQAMFLPAQAHAGQNTGGTELKILVVELKPAADAAAAPAKK